MHMNKQKRNSFWYENLRLQEISNNNSLLAVTRRLSPDEKSSELQSYCQAMLIPHTEGAAYQNELYHTKLRVNCTKNHYINELLPEISNSMQKAKITHVLLYEILLFVGYCELIG